jgi:uncharacterized zinc-type alcohol dehydrogenase-like protein
MTIHAYAAGAKRGPLEPFSYEPEPLGPHDVEIAITHCGICHSDVHLVDGDWGTGRYPMVPGHEIVGTVVAAGAEVGPLASGDRVGVGWQRSACLECELCVCGHENLCSKEEATCVFHHGGFADRVRVDGRFAFRLPDALASEAAAPLLCGGATVYAPLQRWARPSARVGVVGIGGLGHLALQFASAMGCEVTAISSTPEKEAEARAFGAHRLLAAGDGRALRSAAGSLDLIISTVYVSPDWKLLLRALRPNGVLCLVGAPAEPISIPPHVLLSQKIVTGSAIGSRQVIREMLDFAARHRVAAKTERRPLSDADAALDHVRRGRARYRVVLAA